MHSSPWSHSCHWFLTFTLLFLFKNCRKIWITIFISNSKYSEKQALSTGLFIEKILLATPCYYTESFLYSTQLLAPCRAPWFTQPASYRWVWGLFGIFTFAHGRVVESFVHLSALISAITTLVYAFSWKPLNQNVNAFVILLDLKIALGES